jgi:nitroimidazol reductase NimA-like FMN-containing flavoprotein (pyridoxamine 5'-phosphate oxidase superfamily)
MTGPEPKSADLIATGPTTALSWEAVRDVLKDTRLYWLATVHPTGRPHVRPVLAVWVDGALYTTSTSQARKAGTWRRTPVARSRPAPTA